MKAFKDLHPCIDSAFWNTEVEQNLNTHWTMATGQLTRDKVGE